MAIDKEQLLKGVFNGNESMLKSLQRILEHHDNEFRSARDRVVTAVLQINSLFLTGWIALLSVGKLNHSCLFIFNSLLLIGCGLHVAVFGLVLGSQWKTLRLHLNSQMRMQMFQNVVNNSFAEKRKFVATLSDNSDLASVVDELTALEKPIVAFSENDIAEYNEENKITWRFGYAAAWVFFPAMIFSLISFIILIKA